MSETLSDARTLPAPALLRSAAKLIERALIQIDMAEAPCPTCETRLFRSRDSARVYEQLTDLPQRLHAAAAKLEDAEAATRAGQQVSSRGYRHASTAAAVKRG